MEKLLLTGASGFIGRGVLKQLISLSKYEIYATTTQKEKLKEYRNIVNVVEIDLLDSEAVSKLFREVKPERLIHLAWSLEGDNKFVSSYSNLGWLECSLNIIREFINNGGKRVVFAGSSSEYDFSETALNEKMNMPSMNLYGKCKKAVTDVASEICKLHEVSFATARYFSVYGENDNRNSRAIPSAIKKICNDEMVICESPNNIWDYIYIEDAAKATIRLLESEFQGVINIGSGQPVYMKDVFDLIAKLLNKKDHVKYENLDKKGKMLVSDSSKLNKEIGFYCEVGLREGLIKTIEWYKANE